MGLKPNLAYAAVVLTPKKVVLRARTSFFPLLFIFAFRFFSSLFPPVADSLSLLSVSARYLQRLVRLSEV